MLSRSRTNGQPEGARRIGRRAFLHRGGLLLAGGALGGGFPADLLHRDSSGVSSGPRIGLITDLHYADKDAAGTRHYRETPRKLAEAARELVRREPDFVVALGDLIDAAPSVDLELTYLTHIQGLIDSLLPLPRHYVLGNHCVDTLTKAEFLQGVGQGRSYYSFDSGGFHFVVLDACFRADGAPYGRNNSHWTDGNLPEEELQWLAEDLSATANRTIVFAHQRLDVSGDHSVRNAPLVREVLERSGKVLAVFQGHSHRNDLQEIAGIHYCTLVAMVEGSGEASSGYSLLELLPGDLLRLSGFRHQASYAWPEPGPLGPPDR